MKIRTMCTNILEYRTYLFYCFIYLFGDLTGVAASK